MKKFSKTSFLLAIISLFMLGCATSPTKTIGNSIQDDDIKAMFENYENVSNYSYFYTGYGNGPEAIVGIKKNYELVKVSGRGNVTNWQQFEPGDEKLKEIVDGIKAANLPLRRPPFGYNIYAPGADQVGVMYATKGKPSYTDIRLMDGNHLEVTAHNDNSHWAPS